MVFNAEHRGEDSLLGGEMVRFVDRQPRYGRVTGILREGAEAMEVHFTPEVQAKLEQMARDTGRRSDELVENVVADFFEDFAFTRETLDHRYDDLESGRVKPIPGGEVFARLRAKSAARRAGRQ
jgi:predicted transcriptional regulator